MTKYKSFEQKYGLTVYKIYEALKSSSTTIEAAEILKMPYKTLAKVAKEMGVFKEKEKEHKGEAPLDEIIKGLHPDYGSTKLKKRLIEAGLKEWKCEQEGCGITNWLGQEITLELDHINGNNSDHRIENLRILCPNCHSQTPTYRSKKRPSEEIGKA